MSTRMRIEPPPKDELRRSGVAVETAAQRKWENVSAQSRRRVAARDPRRAHPTLLTLHSTRLMRLRADHDVNASARRHAESRVVIRKGRRFPCRSIENRDPGYLLGRLFAAYEHAQTPGARPQPECDDQGQVLWGRVRDTAQGLYPARQGIGQVDLSKLAKEGKGLSPSYLERQIAAIMEHFRSVGRPGPGISARRAAVRRCSRSATTTNASSYRRKDHRPRRAQPRRSGGDAA